MRWYLQFWETQADQEVGSPVGETRDSHGSRSGSLWEELSHDEPGDGTWTHLKTGDKTEHSHYGQVAYRFMELLLREGNKEEKGMINMVS